MDYSILLTNNYVSCRKSMGKKDACISAIVVLPLGVYVGNHYHFSRIYYPLYIHHGAIGDLGHLIGRGRCSACSWC